MIQAHLDSISLPAKNSEHLRDFYVTVFGLKENKQQSKPPGFFMIQGGRGCNILVMDADGSETETGAKGFELGMEVDTLDGLDKKVVESGGSVVQNKQQMQWGTSMIIADPEGHHINAYIFKKEER